MMNLKMKLSYKKDNKKNKKKLYIHTTNIQIYFI